MLDRPVFNNSMRPPQGSWKGGKMPHLASIEQPWVLGEDPFSAHLFVFINRRRDKFKALSWDQNGFVLYYKRLERGHFRWPVIPTGQTALVIEYRQLQWLLSGLSIEQRLALPPVPARVVA